MRKILSVLLVSLLIYQSNEIIEPVEVRASSHYITVNEFTEELANELKISLKEGSMTPSYSDTLINLGIIKSGDFVDYSKNLTRGDMLMLLSRADDYVNKPTIDAKLVNEVIAKRISDISKVPDTKREDIAKGYIKGMMKGYSNGAYSSNRKLKLTSKVTKAGALSCLKMINDKSLRAKISPDGQLIRTTNLPKNAKLFPYILASYPNKYYEWQLLYQRASIYDENGKLRDMKNHIDYAAPANMDVLEVDSYNNFATLKKEKLSEWVEKAEKHLKLVFSVDYRTIGNEWVNDMLKVNFQYGTYYEKFPEKKLNEYVDLMKANKTIVDYKTIAVDGSSLYYFNDSFYMRVYVKYRIKSSIVEAAKDVDEYMSKHPYNKILFSNVFVKLDGFKLNEWKEGYFDIVMADANDDGNLGVHGIWYDLGKVLD